MAVTLSGIVTLFRALQPWNAELAMLVTGQPLIVSGMLTTPLVLAQVHPPVMVIAPLLVTQVKHPWAWTARGSMSSSRGSSPVKQAVLKLHAALFETARASLQNEERQTRPT